MFLRTFCKLFFALTLISCTEEIPLNIPAGSSQFVINCLISDDHPVQLHLSQVISLSDTAYPTIRFAEPTLRNDTNEELIDSFHFDASKNLYEGTQPITLYNQTLRLKVLVNGEIVSASTTIPRPVRLLSAKKIHPSGYDEYGDGLTEFQINFNDPNEEENFYELFLFDYSYDEKLLTERSGFRSNENLNYIDPIILAEGLEQYENKSLLFSDRLFNGESTTIVVKYLPNVLDGKAGSLIDISKLENQKSYALLRTVSKEYYEYRKAWTIHRYSQQRKPPALKEDPLLDDFSRFLFVGDPVEMSNSIENGLGIFAGFSQSIIEVQNR